MSQIEEELYELPEWVKLVNRILHGKKWNDEKRNFDRVSVNKEI